ncbi:hypothetical protein PVAP13_4NG000711 [Panicum virgatum]|uniref:Uncharacterized protein n=1 Tax=Panicum virgatum TaxID=38727 RepID=A0A8T0TD32_PANVG|nr:hypothetical protein PVAP13_4NG000711 [Panicum virgatum]
MPQPLRLQQICFCLLPIPISTHGQATILLLILVASIHHIAYAAASTTSANLTSDATTTAYDILEKNKFPRGLLPKGVRSYVLNPHGKLEVTLSRECRFPVNLGGQRFNLQFASTFGGVIHAGSITEVYGVDVQVKYAWLGFSQVDRAGDQLTFHVKQLMQSFPISGFAESPSCT